MDSPYRDRHLGMMEAMKEIAGNKAGKKSPTVSLSELILAIGKDSLHVRTEVFPITEEDTRGSWEGRSDSEEEGEKSAPQGFVAPPLTFTKSDQPSDTLAKKIKQYMVSLISKLLYYCKHTD